MPDRDPSHLFPSFRAKVLEALEEMQAWLNVHRPGHTAKVIEGFRSTARQQELYAQGRTKPGHVVTQKNGTTNKSNHQSSLAIDLGVFDARGHYLEEPDRETMAYWGHCARAQGLEWGGDWKSFVDQPHVEWPTRDHKTYTLARAWQEEVGLK